MEIRPALSTGCLGIPYRLELRNFIPSNFLPRWLFRKSRKVIIESIRLRRNERPPKQNCCGEQEQEKGLDNLLCLRAALPRGCELRMKISVAHRVLLMSAWSFPSRAWLPPRSSHSFHSRAKKSLYPRITHPAPPHCLIRARNPCSCPHAARQAPGAKSRPAPAARR